MKSTAKARLIKKGRALFERNGPFESFSGDTEADALLFDLKNHPHAFVIACLADRQISAERAWLIPHTIRQRIGTFHFKALSRLPLVQIEKAMDGLHRFPKIMSGIIHKALARIETSYSGNAALIWAGYPSSAEVVYRFLQFDGAGPKIATMATNILARRFRVPFRDYYSIDISVDVHVRRVFQRLGFISADASQDEVIYKARALSPEFPGLLDFPAWEIGRNWCRPTRPKCGDCYMQPACDYSQSK